MLAACYQPRRRTVHLWSSGDDGASWHHDGDSECDWPQVTLLADPPLLALGNTIFTDGGGGHPWRRQAALDGPIKTVTRSPTLTVALTTNGLWHSCADGTWLPLATRFPHSSVRDIALAGNRLAVLLSDGALWHARTRK